MNYLKELDKKLKNLRKSRAIQKGTIASTIKDLDFTESEISRLTTELVRLQDEWKRERYRRME